MWSKGTSRALQGGGPRPEGAPGKKAPPGNPKTPAAQGGGRPCLNQPRRVPCNSIRGKKKEWSKSFRLFAVVLPSSPAAAAGVVINDQNATLFRLPWLISSERYINLKKNVGKNCLGLKTANNITVFDDDFAGTLPRKHWRIPPQQEKHPRSPQRPGRALGKRGRREGERGGRGGADGGVFPVNPHVPLPGRAIPLGRAPRGRMGKRKGKEEKC